MIGLYIILVQLCVIFLRSNGIGRIIIICIVLHQCSLVIIFKVQSKIIHLIKYCFIY